MTLQNTLYRQEVIDTRSRFLNLRKDAEISGSSKDAFYDDIRSRMAEHGVFASITWVRDQCDPEHLSDPTYAKFKVLISVMADKRKELNQSSVSHGARNADKDDISRVLKKPADEPTVTARESRITEPDDIEKVIFDEDVERATKKLLNDPEKALLGIARLLNQIINRHTAKGGTIMHFLEYIRARAEFTHNIALSNMPLHALRSINTVRDARTANPGLKTTLAIYSVLLFLNSIRTKFPWGDNDFVIDNLREIRDVLKQREKANQAA